MLICHYLQNTYMSYLTVSHYTLTMSAINRPLFRGVTSSRKCLIPVNTTPIQPPVLQTAFFPQDEGLPLTCRLSQPAPCLLAFTTESFLLSFHPLPSSLSSSSLTSSSLPLPPHFGSRPADPSFCQPPDRELTWTLDTVPARLTRLFAQSRVDNNSSTTTSARADHVWNREGFNAVTAGTGKQAGHGYLNKCKASLETVQRLIFTLLLATDKLK